MSIVRLLDLVKDLVQDPALGLAVKVEAIAETVETDVRSDFRLHSWLLPAQTPTDGPQVLLRFGDAAIEPDFAGERISDGVVQIEIGFRTAHHDLVALQNEVAVYADAVRWLMNDLRAFSDQQIDTRKIQVTRIVDRITLEPLIGPQGTFNGFLATIPIQERSTYV